MGGLAYGQPVPADGAWAVSTCRFVARRPCARCHAIRSPPSQGCPVCAPERTGKAAAVQVDRLEHVASFADAHALSVGAVGVPDGAFGVQADPVADVIAEVDPHPRPRQAAVAITAGVLASSGQIAVDRAPVSRRTLRARSATRRAPAPPLQSSTTTSSGRCPAPAACRCRP
jgi:hypothetical protein